jgi:hypothetical protein
MGEVPTPDLKQRRASLLLVLAEAAMSERQIHSGL